MRCDSGGLWGGGIKPTSQSSELQRSLVLPVLCLRQVCSEQHFHRAQVSGVALCRLQDERLNCALGWGWGWQQSNCEVN